MKTLMTLMILMATMAIAGPRDISNPVAASKQKVDAAISTNATTSVTYATLYAEWRAANNQTKKDAVVGKLFAKLAGIETIEANQKKNNKANAGKVKVLK